MKHILENISPQQNVISHDKKKGTTVSKHQQKNEGTKIHLNKHVHTFHWRGQRSQQVSNTLFTSFTLCQFPVSIRTAALTLSGFLTCSVGQWEKKITDASVLSKSTGLLTTLKNNHKVTV